MKYFVSYAEIYGNKDNVKREKLRLESYNLAINFLDRGKKSENYIFERFDYLKRYFESKEFCSVYFLSPFILNESKLVRDLVAFIMTSGETNQFNKLINEIIREVELIKPSNDLQTKHRIQVKNADDFLDIYFKHETPIEELYLVEDSEYKLLMQIAKNGYMKKDETLSVLYVQLLLRNATSKDDIDKIIAIGKKLYATFSDNADLVLLIAACYFNQYYRKDDKGKCCLHWYGIAATKFNKPSAMYMVGLIHFMGMGVKKNQEKAIASWSEAARLNNLDAIACIGIYYLQKGDKKSAKVWLERSAASGDYKSLLLLDTDFERI